MKINAAISRNGWLFPLTLLVLLFLVTAIATGAARAQGITVVDAGANGVAPVLDVHLAAAVVGTPLMAVPKAATSAQAYMALGLLFLIAAVAMMTLGWREPGSRNKSEGGTERGRPVGGDWVPGDD